MNTCTKLLRRLALLAAIAAVLTAGALAADAEADSPEAFYAALETFLDNQDDNFSIAYTGDREALGLPSDTALGSCLRTMSARSADGPDNADYPALNIADGQMGWLDGAYYFDIDYLDTPDEIAEVSRQAQEIVDSLSLEGEDDYIRVKLLYEYICTHFTYDDSLTRYSAYDGLTTGSMVCQGYALLTYRVMWDAGIPCRIVTGTSRQQNHAWNIVELDGVWYNLDATWDAADEAGGAMSWDYFLRSEEEFGGHTRFSPYTTDDYHSAHPMAQESWALPRVTVTVNGTTPGTLVVRAGVPVQLEAAMSDGTDAEIRWSSSDPDLVEVTPDGRLLASGLGDVVLTAQVDGDRGVISARIPAQVVDLRTASPWAYEAVTDYYLSQLLPFSLCSDFQQGITRAELARLVDQFILQTRGWDSMSIHNPFTDLTTGDDVLSILRCYSAGLMTGTSETTFSPEQTVTREQAAVVLARLVALLDGETPQSAPVYYPDADEIHDWALDAVGAMTASGVLQGGDTRFVPQGEMTLEQMVVALNRVYAPRAEQLAAEKAA